MLDLFDLNPSNQGNFEEDKNSTAKVEKDYATFLYDRTHSHGMRRESFDSIVKQFDGQCEKHLPNFIKECDALICELGICESYLRLWELRYNTECLLGPAIETLKVFLREKSQVKSEETIESG